MADRDPGPKTQDGTGSGFLCVENDDPTAELQCRAFDAAGIAPPRRDSLERLPAVFNRAPKAAERQAGVDPLLRLLGLLPQLRIVLLQGRDAPDIPGCCVVELLACPRVHPTGRDE